jgi:hypothetical protein
MKKVTIEGLLSWAFTQELCKVGAPMADYVGVGFSQAWSTMSEVAMLGTIVDRQPNMYGVIPNFIHDLKEAHVDALEVGEAVRALAQRGGFEIGQGWNPFPEWEDERGIVAVEVARAVEILRLKGDRLSGKHVVNLVTSAAILGRGPDWSAKKPNERIVMARGMPAWFVGKKARDAFGRAYTYEADGFDRRKRRPVKGAYQKVELSEPILAAILSRLDWQLWQDALQVLAEELRGRCKSHELVSFVPDRSPWRRTAISTIAS